MGGSLFDYWVRYPFEKIAMPEQSATAVEPMAPVFKPSEQSRQKPKRQPPYHVILWNDESHTYEYVIAMMMEVFGFPLEKGFQIAKEVDTQGRAIVLTTTMEHAELKRDQIHAYGKDAQISTCKGSMWSTIEPAE
jgi:ATP-dependent Clp protease adaptor protein ClpS